MRRAALLVILVLGAGGGRPAAADTVPSRRYATHDGLPSKQITALAQTANGLLWVGTQNGLAVYDGYQFRRIPTPDSIRQKQVSALRPMPDGSVWVGIGHDAMRVTPRGVARVLLLGDHLNSDVLRRGESVLFVTDRAVWTLGPTRSRPSRTPLRFPTPGVRNVWGADLDPDGRLWIAAGGQGPARVAQNGQVTHPAASVFANAGGPGESVYDVHFLGGTEALVARGAGLYRYDWAAQTLDRVARTAADGPLDIGGRGRSVYLTGGTQVRRYDRAASRMRAPVGAADRRAATTAALRGREGGLWVGTENGLLSFPNPEARHLRAVDGTPIRNGTGFRKTGEVLWGNTWGAGIFQIRPRRRSMRPGGYARWVLLRSRDGRVHGLADAPGQASRRWFRWTARTGWRRVGSVGGGVRGYVDSSGVGYFWHNDGLYRHTPRGDTVEATRLRSWPLDDSQHHLMGPAPNGDLVLFDEGTVLRLRRPDGAVVDTLASVPAHAESQGRRLQVDAAGRVWCPFRGAGLLRIDPRRGTTETLLEGAVVESVNMAADSLALVKTTSGLYLLDARTGRERQRLTEADGLFSNDVNGAQIVGDTLYVGHKAGIALLPLESVLGPPPAPHAVLTGLEVNFDDRPLRTGGGWAAEERTVGFSYTGASLAHANQVRYEVRLTPRDSVWKTTDRRFARYTDLAPGTYRFEVRGRLNGQPPGPAAAYTFTIPPHFYETSWFRVLVGLCLLGAIGGAYRWRVYRLQRRQAELERAVEARTQELAEEKKKTEAQAERLAELDEAKNRFFAHVSHEFRTPLSLILSPLRDALQRAADDSVTFGGRQVRRMTRNAERLQRLIDQLLDLATLEAGRMELDRRPGDLAALVGRSVEAFRSRAEQNEVALRVEAPGERMPMQFDPEKVETIVSNLVGNALKFTPSGGRVAVRIRRAEAPGMDEAVDEAAVIEVTDTGPGMAPEVQEGIFDRFAQADTAATRGQSGTGLGLALTKELTELHGGTVHVDSAPGEGATFTVRLPLVPVAAERVDDAAPEAADGLVHAGMGGKRPAREEDAAGTEEEPDAQEGTILVVEDNAEMRTYLREELSGRWHVIAAPDGEAGWERVRADEPDLVVSDVMMPGLSGTELCRKIKADEALRAIPVLLLTARAGEEATVAGLEAGADDYVSKPFGPDELRGRIENHLAARRHLEARYREEVSVEVLGAVVEAEEQPFVERVMEAAEEQLSNPDFGVGDLAEEMALSRRQLTRRLKGAVGEPPGQVLRQLRIERGKQLLEEGAETVSEVAYATGFRSPSAFSHAFGEVVGQTPTAYADAHCG